MKEFWLELCKRWNNAMPKFYRIVFWVCSLISGTALAANTAMMAAGAMPHEWWSDIYPYLIGFPAGMAFAAKFSQQYHGRPVDYDEYRRKERHGKTILDEEHHFEHNTELNEDNF